MGYIASSTANCGNQTGPQPKFRRLKGPKTVTLFLCWVVLVASLFSAHICCKRLLRTRDRTIFFLSVMVLWITLLIVSVQFLGELEIVGIISRVTLPRIALLLLVVLGGAVSLSFAWRPLTTLSFGHVAAGFHERLPFYLKALADHSRGLLLNCLP